MNAKIKEELLSIKAQADDGLLRPPAVLAWAEANPESAIYNALDWDDAHAAREHRLGQIRGLISLHIVTADGEPQMVSLSFDRSKGGGYRAVDDVVKDRDLSRIMLADALAELERIQAKYERVKELTAVWEKVRSTRRKLRATEGAQARP